MTEGVGGFLPTTVSHILIILTLLLSGVAIIMAAIGAAFSFRQSSDNIEDLENEINRLKDEVEMLKKRPVATPVVVAPPPPPEPEPEPEPFPEIEFEPEPEPPKPVVTEMSIDDILNSAPIWQNMLDDYHALLDAFDPEKGVGLVEPFVMAYNMQTVVCREHATLENGKIMPKFINTDDITEASFWAWPIDGQPGDYAIVPSPLVPYDKHLHEEGGMKETFAAQYEDGEIYTKMRVEIPALFTFRKDVWTVDQPGLLKIEK